MTRREKLDRILASRSLTLSQLEEEGRNKLLLEKKLEVAETAREILQKIAKATQETAHQQIAGIVSRCLKAVFGEDAYEFRIEFREARGKTEAHLLFVRDGEELDPLDSTGGGVVDVASMALRIACLLLARPRKRLFFAADEPFRHLSKEYRPRVRELLQTLARETGIQFLIVTHFQELECGKVVEL